MLIAPSLVVAVVLALLALRGAIAFAGDARRVSRILRRLRGGPAILRGDWRAPYAGAEPPVYDRGR